MPEWRNRIIGHGVQPASEFLANPDNWRLHPPEQREALSGALNEVGWVQEVIVNTVTGHLVDGHERVWQALHNDDAMVPYLEVELSPEEEAYALATLDPIGAMAKADKEKLEALMQGVTSAEPGVMAMLAELAKEAGLFGEDSQYSRKIEAPIYEPSEELPELGHLFNAAKTEALVREIDEAEGLSEGERAFLRIAAQRHTVLYFDKIADYYAQASEGMQLLMENSALVIIDFDRAIELGYVQLTKRIAEQVRDEYGE